MMRPQSSTASDPRGPVSFLTSGAFVVVLSSAGMPVLPQLEQSQHLLVTTARDVSPPVTFQRDFQVVKNGWNPTMVVTEKILDSEGKPVDFDTGNWEQLVEIPVEWVSVIREVREYAGLDDGWKGPDSIAVSDSAVEQSLVLVEQLARSLPLGPCPMVGADEDGNIVLSWSDDELFGSLSIRGSGSYSFYMKRGASVCKAARVPIFAAPPDTLVSFLLT